jgi:hypothetical protein
MGNILRDGNGSIVKKTVTLNIVLVILVQLCIIVGTVWAISTWIGSSVLAQKLEIYHTRNMGEVSTLIDQKIDFNKLLVERDRLILMRDMDKQLTNIELILKDLQRQVSENNR